MNNQFGEWLSKAIEEKGWSQSEAARRGEISSSMINLVINGQAHPGMGLYRGIARAFNMPLEDVFRIAGILPQVRQRRLIYRTGADSDEARLRELWEALGPEDRQLAIALLERLAAQEPRIIGAPAEE